MNGQIFYCNDNYPKKFKITFSSGLLENDDTWLLCYNCYKKPEFQQYRLTEKIIQLGDK